MEAIEGDPPTTIHDLMGVEGMLEDICTCLTSAELRNAMLISKVWRDAARDDEVWRPMCVELWRDKQFSPSPAEGGPSHLFWRSVLTRRVLARLSVKQMRTLARSRGEAHAKVSKGRLWLGRTSLSTRLPAHLPTVCVSTSTSGARPLPVFPRD